MALRLTITTSAQDASATSAPTTAAPTCPVPPMINTRNAIWSPLFTILCVVKRWMFGDLAAALAVACVAVGLSSGFAAQQEIWLDETTQLAGLSLGPARVLPWLAGADPGRFAGIPADRMPPLSYWVGWLWSQAFGRSEASLRALGVALGAAAALLVFASARRLWGRAAGYLAGLSFALSPNVIVSSVEIR